MNRSKKENPPALPIRLGSAVRGLALAATIALLACGTPPTGLIVEKVDSWGEAARAGIEPGDVIEAWSTGGQERPATNAIELAWVGWNAAAQEPVKLRVRRAGRILEVLLDEAGWGIQLRPALTAPALATYQAARDQGADYSRATWDGLESEVEGTSDLAAWAAWRHAWAAFLAGDSETGRAAFARARSRVQLPEIKNFLVTEEAYALARVGKRHDALVVFEEALAGGCARCPLRALNLSRKAASLIVLEEPGLATQALDEADEILSQIPNAEYYRTWILNRRGGVAWVARNLAEAERFYTQALERLDRGGPPGAKFCQDLAMTLESQGYYEKARTLYNRALKSMEGIYEARVLRAYVLNALGILNVNLGGLDRADVHFRRALELFPKGGLEEAGMSNNIGELAVQRGNLGAAEDYLRRSLELARGAGAGPLSIAETLHNLAFVLRERGRLHEAETMFRESLAIAEAQVPESLYLSPTIFELARTKLEKGEAEEARRLVERSLALENEFAPEGLGWSERTLALGDVELATGRRDRAVALWQAGLRGIENLRERISSEQGRARFSARFDRYYRKLADAYLDANEKERAFITLEKSRARMLRAMLLQYGDQVAMAKAPDLHRERRQLDSRIADQLRRMATLRLSEASTEIDQLRVDVERLKTEREELTERIHRSSGRLARLERLPAVSLRLIKENLPGGSVGLLYSMGEKESRVFVLHPASTSRSLEVVTLPVTREEIEQRVEIFRGLLERGRVNSSLEHALVTQGAGLFDLLVRPVAEDIESATSLIIAPDSVLAGLPFAALVRSVEPLSFLAQWQPHTILPSLTSMGELREVAAGRHEPAYEFVAVGAPAFTSDNAGERSLALGALPGSRRELDRLQELFPDSHRTLTGDAATESATRDLLHQGRFVHFATHALLDQRFPLDSSLALLADSDPTEPEDGLLHGWEIMEGAPLAAELVTLAACETGRGARWDGEGLIGLTQAFHYIGAPTVLASQWRVGDRWVGELTESFYGHVLAGLRPMEALAAAQREMIAATPGRASRAHPFYWAGFSIFGVG